MTGRWFGPVEASGGGRPRPGGGRTPTCRGADDSDDGRAMIEVIFLAVLMLIPVVYILISVLRIQAATFAVTQAARDAGRAIDNAPTLDDGITRARQIAAIDLTDQHISDDQLTVTFVNPGTGCTNGNTISPSIDGGAVYDICITAIITLPGVPSVLTGSKNTVTGVYTVHIGDLREGK
jgi:Flp pilus assembly protein TadG